MKKSVIVPAAILAAVLALISAALFFFFSPKPAQTPQPLAESVAPEAAEPAQPDILYPLAETPAAPHEDLGEPRPDADPGPPLPLEVEDGDAALPRLLALLDGKKQLIELFIPDHFIQRFVVTIDNLPNKELPRKQLPVKGVGGLFLIQGGNEGERINPYNAQRYTPYVNLAEALGTPELVDLYVRLYPLAQKAFDDLGHPKAYFNDRLITVIDHLLATPEPAEPIFLKRPNVLYQYADPDLEGRSSGQKILLRVGAENRARLKAKLHHLRAELLTRVVVQKTEKTEP